MTTGDYNAAKAIQDELQLIDALLTPAPPGTPVAPAYTFHGALPKEPAIVTLAQTALDDANAGWETVLNDRKTALLASFDALGGA